MPSTLVCTTSSGFWYEYGIAIRAPRWKTHSRPATALRTASGSFRSPRYDLDRARISAVEPVEVAAVVAAVVADEGPDLVPVADQPLDQVAADEPRRPPSPAPSPCPSQPPPFPLT